MLTVGMKDTRLRDMSKYRRHGFLEFVTDLYTCTAATGEGTESGQEVQGDGDFDHNLRRVTTQIKIIVVTDVPIRIYYVFRQADEKDKIAYGFVPGSLNDDMP